MPLQQIDSYVVMYSANHFPPRIWLTGGGAPLGQLVFEPNGKALEEDHETGDGHVSMYYHLDDFQNVIHLLEGNVPVFLLYSGRAAGSRTASGRHRKPWRLRPGQLRNREWRWLRAPGSGVGQNADDDRNRSARHLTDAGTRARRQAPPQATLGVLGRRTAWKAPPPRTQPPGARRC